METYGEPQATWSRRDVGRAWVALAGGFLIAGCQPQRPSIQTRDPQGGYEGMAGSDRPAPAEVQALLDRRAKALQAGDEQAFLADLDQSNQELLKRERLRFANLSQFELSNVGFVMPQQLGGAGTGGVYEFSPVLQITQLSADAGPGGVAPAEAFRYAVASKDGKLVATDVAPLVGDAAEQLGVSIFVHANAPWNTTPLRVLQAGNVWLAGDDSVPELERYAAAAKAQVGAVEALWGDRPRFPGYVLFFTRNETNLNTWYDLGESRPPAGWEGVEITLQGVRTNGQVYNGQYAAARIVVNLASIALGSNDPASLMRHELTHAVTSRAGAVTQAGFGDRVFVTPRWAIEGFADWVQELEDPNGQAQLRAVVADGVRAGKFGGAPPGSQDFYGDDIHFNYAVSASLFRFIEQNSGTDAAVEFYARVIKNQDSREQPLVEKPAFDAICQEVLGAGSGAFLQAWSGFVQGGA